MAINKPYNINIRGQTIDAKRDVEIRWIVTGAMQTSYAVKIYDNVTNSIAFSVSKTTSYDTGFILARDSITNGKEYKIEVQVWDEFNTTAKSDIALFKASSTPVVILNSALIVTSPSVRFEAKYTQAENEAMRTYQALLYNNYGNLIDSSGLKTDGKLEHIFSRLESNEYYFIEFQATSASGIVGTTGKLRFDVSYTRPEVSAALKAENWENASIKLSWNVTQLLLQAEGHTFPDDEHIDVRNGRVWTDKLNIENDFAIGIWIKDVYEWRKKPIPPEPEPPIEIVNDADGIIAFKDKLDIFNAVWVKDEEQQIQRPLGLIASKNPPSNFESLWIKDKYQHKERVLQSKFQVNPESADVIKVVPTKIKYRKYYIEDDRPVKNPKYLLKLRGKNGEIYLEYYHSKFHAFKKVGSQLYHIFTEEVVGDKFFVCLQQVGDLLSLHVKKL